MKIFNLIFYFLYFFVFGQNYLLAQGTGTYHQYDLNVDGQNRQYTLYEPPGYDGTEALPIVFLFHGFSVPIELQIEISRMYEVADTANFFIVYPQGLEVEDAVFGGFGTGWNLPKSYKGEQDDVAFVNAMIDDLIANPAFKINPSRVHATGFSNGGEMSYLLGCTLSDRIASVASVANPMTDTMVNEICVPSKQIATMHIQGTADVFFAEAGIPPFLPLEASAQFWANKNGCDITPTITMLNDINAADNSTVSLLSYENCDANFEVKTYKITNGGHSWPGGWLPEELSFLGSVNQDFNASVEIWNFFKRNPNTRGRLLEKTYYYPDSLRTPGTLASLFPFSDSIREYLLYVPAAYDGSEKWPLVINMHGYALSPEFQVDYSNMNAVADTAHFLVAYPKGTTIISTVPNTPPQGLGFNVSGEGDSSFVSPTNENEVFFIENMIYQISEDFKIDQARIYATGFSNGGMMATVLASELPSLIAAAASVGGAPPISRPIRPFGPDRPTPVLYIHGTADSIVPYIGSELTTSLPEVLETWAKENGCDDAIPVLTSLPDIDPNDGSIVQSLSWQNCDAETQHLLIVDGGHQWPGGNNLLPFLGNFNNDINASSEIWNFFKRNPHPNPSGKILLKTMKPDSILREYLLYVPAAYDGSEDWPLVLNIHGYRLTADFQMFFSNMNPVADTAHFLIACPQGTQIISNIPNLRPGGGFGFNIAGEGDNSYVSPGNVNDVEFMSKLIDRISEDYRVAQDQVYSTGFSNGGMLSTILGSELENKIAAIAPVAGTIPRSRPFEPQRPMPVLYIYGTSDPLAFYENDVFLRGVPEVLETWATTNGCDAEPVVTAVPDIETSDNSTVELLEWKNCDAEVLHFKVLGGGHNWPGGNNFLPFLGNFNLDINSSSEIWNFFSRQRLPQATARVQFIHAASNETVSVTAGGKTLVEKLAFQTATPYLDIPAGTPLEVTLTPVNPRSTTAPITTTLTLEAGETYTVAVVGTTKESDAYPVEFAVLKGAKEKADNPTNIALGFVASIPDGTPTDALLGDEILFDNIDYKDFFAHKDVPAANLTINETPANDNTTIALQVNANIAFWRGKSAVLFQTGLLSNGTYQPWIALSNGGTFPLSFTTPNSTTLAPTDFKVDPNPSSEFTQLTIELATAQSLTIQLIDQHGQVVETVFSGNVNAGNHTFPHHLTNLRAGWYTYRMVTNEAVMTKAFVKE